MPRQTTRADKRIRIYPVDGVSFYPWKPIEQEVNAADWRLLSEVRPPPFTDQPPSGEVKEPSTYRLEPGERVIPHRQSGSQTEPDKPTEPTEQVGSSDSEGSE